MPRYYERSGPRSLPGMTTADRVLGNDSNKRSTKTLFKNERTALLVSLIRAHTESHIQRLRRMHRAETGKVLTVEQILNLYPGAKAWVETHDQIVDHYVSQKGTSLRAFGRLGAFAGNDVEGESSIRGGEQVGEPDDD